MPADKEKRDSSLTVNGLLPADGGAAAKQAVSGDVTRELEAQYRFMMDAGCMPDHADSHGGNLYGINGRLFLSQRFPPLPKIPSPFPFCPFSLHFWSVSSEERYPPALKAAHAAVCFLADRMKVSLPDDFITHPLPVEKIRDYEALCSYYEEQLAAAPAGISEVFLHPSVPDPVLSLRTPQWKKQGMGV